MKKIYALFVVCFFLTATSSAQTYYWIGPTSGAPGNWNDNNNWSLSSHGAAVGLGVFPNGATHNVIFDGNAVVNVNVENIDLLSLSVNNSATAKLVVTASVANPVAINLLSTSPANPSLKINTGSRLEDSCDVNLPFTVSFGADAKAVVDGTWYFAGKSTVNGGNGATFSLPGLTGLSNRLDVNGTIQFRNNTLSPNPVTGQDYIYFNSGSTYWIDRNQGNSPRANWNANSTILVTGTTTVAPSINVGSIPEIGNLVFNCPNLSIATLGWSITNNLVVKGDFQVLGTNNKLVVLASNGSVTVNNFNYTVNGDFTVSGNSRVAIANASNANKVVDFQVLGDVNIGGNTFDIQISNQVVSNPTTLKIKGNLNHTAGTFGASSNSTNLTTDLFVIEMNGTTPQSISSIGTIDNITNEVSLLLNNASGVNLSTPLSIGKISFNSANKGKLNTNNTNVLTINNTGTHSLVVNSPSSSGFVNGPVRRRTSVTTDYLFPTGKGSTYDPLQIRPLTASVSVYQAEYFNNAYSDLSVISPLNGVSNQEYWSVSTISGVDAAVTLTLTGAVPGATGSDGIAVSHYNGADWTDYSVQGGTIITPGTATSGSARSLYTQQNGFYTFGFGLAGALPIRLLTFDARKVSASTAQVSWTIASSSNAQSFEVLRSSDGRNFSNVGSIHASDRQFAYSFNDMTLPTGTSYYKLKLTDKDGIISYSQVIAVLNGSKGVLLTSLIPTVVSSSATLSISSSERGTMQLMVTDMYGRVVKQQLAAIGTGNQQVVLNLAALPAGAYQVTAVMNDTRVGTIRFVRQ